MPYILRGDHVACAFAGGEVATERETVAFAVHRLPDLLLPSGRIGASDPLVDPRPATFAFCVNPGLYRVDLAIGRFNEDDQRVGFARITFADATVHHWRIATTSGQDASTLGPDQIFGYGVDSGTGCFMSPEVGVLLEARMRKEPNYFETMIEEMQKTYRHTWSWADLRPGSGAPENLLAFSSGFGDGAYASYIGSDAQDRPICLVTDFETLPDQVAETPE